MNKYSVILDCGCGSGIYTEYLNSIDSNFTIIGIDISLENIKEAKNRLSDTSINMSNVYFLVADVNHLPFAPCQFDAISIINVLHHLSQPQRVIDSLSQCLVENGHMLNVEITSNNILNNASRRLFPMMPKYVKKSMQEDIVVDGEIPETNIFKSGELENFIHLSNLDIINRDSYNLFLFLIRYIAKVFPLLNKIPTNFVRTIYIFERRLMSLEYFSRFGVVHIIISKKRCSK